jgi:hypothetical protein
VVATAIAVVTRKRDAEVAMGPATRLGGHLRREMVEIVSLVHNMRGLTQHWASHNARGAYQERAIAKMREALLHCNQSSSPASIIPPSQASSLPSSLLVPPSLPNLSSLPPLRVSLPP